MNIELSVSGMTCGHCETAVAKALKSVPGVTKATVDLAGGKAVVDGNDIDPEKLIEAVVDEGYGAQVAGA